MILPDVLFMLHFINSQRLVTISRMLHFVLFSALEHVRVLILSKCFLLESTIYSFMLSCLMILLNLSEGLQRIDHILRFGTCEEIIFNPSTIHKSNIFILYTHCYA